MAHTPAIRSTACCRQSSFGRLGRRSRITYSLSGRGRQEPAPKEGEEINRRDTNGNDSYLRGAVRVRAQRTASQGGYRVNDWYCDRVGRLLLLWHGSRAHFQPAVLSP